MQKIKLQIKIGRICAAVCITAFLLLVRQADATRLFFSPATGTRQFGDQFAVDIGIDSEGECINAIEAGVAYPDSALRAVDFSRGESILSLWVEAPVLKFDEDLFYFSGGIPGGYCGKISGDTGKGGILGRIIFRVSGFSVGKKSSPVARLEFLPGARVLLADGMGTEARLAVENAEFGIVESSTRGSVDEWGKILDDDTTLPEPFTVEITKDASVFNGKFFLVFSTTDKQSGIDRFEVLEMDEYGMRPGWNEAAKWKVRESPYLLEDQEKKSLVRVKAVDKAGNERIVEFIPEGFMMKEAPQGSKFGRMQFTAVAVGILLAAGVLYIRKRKRNLQMKNEEESDVSR